MSKKVLSEADTCDLDIPYPIRAKGQRRLRRLVLALLAGALLLVGCTSTETEAGSTTRTDATSPGPADGDFASTDVPAEWVVVKYRDTPVNVAGFADLGRTDSSLVFDAWYDAGNDYMVINLTGTNYHYCAFPGSAWDALRGAESMGSHYHDFIKGSYDCRYVGVVPSSQ